MSRRELNIPKLKEAVRAADAAGAAVIRATELQNDTITLLPENQVYRHVIDKKDRLYLYLVEHDRRWPEQETRGFRDIDIRPHFGKVALARRISSTTGVPLQVDQKSFICLGVLQPYKSPRHPQPVCEQPPSVGNVASVVLGVDVSRLDPKNVISREAAFAEIVLRTAVPLPVFLNPSDIMQQNAHRR